MGLHCLVITVPMVLVAGVRPGQCHPYLPLQLCPFSCPDSATYPCHPLLLAANFCHFLSDGDTGCKCRITTRSIPRELVCGLQCIGSCWCFARLCRRKAGPWVSRRPAMAFSPPGFQEFFQHKLQSVCCVSGKPTSLHFLQSCHHPKQCCHPK